MDAEILDLLTPGAVCHKRENPRKGAPVTVLVLTNVSLSEKLQEKYPVHVVYANEMRQVFSRTVESFFDLYDFHNVDVDVETRIGDIFTPLDQDYDDEGGIVIDRSRLPVATSATVGLATDADTSAHSHVSASTIVLDDEDDEDDEDDVPAQPVENDDADYDADNEEGQSIPEDTSAEDLGDDPAYDDGQTNDEHGQTQIQFSMTTLEGVPLPALGHSDLTPALAGYSQDPDVVNNRIVHKLAFQLGGAVTIDSLIEAFRPSMDRNTVDVFALVGPHFNDVIQWTDFVGVYPEIGGGEAFANVILVEQLSIPVSEEDPVVSGVVHAGYPAAEPAHDLPGLGADNPIVQETIANIIAAQTDVPPGTAEVVDELIRDGSYATPAPGAEIHVFDRVEGIDKVIVPEVATVVVPEEKSAEQIAYETIPAVAEVVDAEVAPAPAVPNVQNITANLVRNVAPNQPVSRSTLHLPNREGR